MGRGSEGYLRKEPPGGVFTEPRDHGLGRSRGGFTTKLHLTVEQGQKPLSIVVTASRGDSSQFEAVLKKGRVPRDGVGRPRTRPDRVRARTGAAGSSIQLLRSGWLVVTTRMPPGDFACSTA